jgi:hypothetical protein
LFITKDLYHIIENSNGQKAENNSKVCTMTQQPLVFKCSTYIFFCVLLYQVLYFHETLRNLHLLCSDIMFAVSFNCKITSMTYMLAYFTMFLFLSCQMTQWRWDLVPGLGGDQLYRFPAGWHQYISPSMSSLLTHIHMRYVGTSSSDDREDSARSRLQKACQDLGCRVHWC